MNNERRIYIERIADNVRIECKISDYGVKDIFEATEKLGFRSIRYPLGETSFLGAAMIKNSDRIVFTNSSIILSREIFSVAHEIGHHKLHLMDNKDTFIKDNNFNNTDEYEVEANYFAACLLAPREEITKFIRLELKEKDTSSWSGLDIARIQTAFSISYDMVLTRLLYLNILDEKSKEKLKAEKAEYTATKLLSVIGGNTELCKKTEVRKIPFEYIEWVISNYNEKLIPKESLNQALEYVDLNVEDLIFQNEEEEEEESLDDLLRGLE